MEFYTASSLQSISFSIIIPSVVLITDNWDDYHYKTLFKLYYIDEKKTINEIGYVKILQNEIFKTVLPNNFQNLSSEYCSLGQNIEYYKALKTLGSNTAFNICRSLNDVVLNKKIYDDFVSNAGFRNSLIRFSEAEKALKEGAQFFNQIVIEKNFSFRFVFCLPKANKAHEFNFEFEKNTHLPNRINAIIGKNGTGKTQILAKIAALASGYSNQQEKVKQFFYPERPSFSKIIAISYSVFDEFDRPKEKERTFSYKYCGIRDDKNQIISLKTLRENFEKNLSILKNKKRYDIWRNVLDEIIEAEHRNALESLINQEDVTLSSGQNLIIMIMTEVIVNIEDESLLLFDEPEAHLHPNALSNLIRMFNKLLDEFHSYAIITTHSPIIIQEIPSRYVNVVERLNNTPVVRKLHLESFGENLSTITNEVFEVRDNESNYKAWFEKMSKTMTYEDISNVFDNQLSYNAKIFLNVIFKNKKDNL